VIFTASGRIPSFIAPIALSSSSSACGLARVVG
jgi:hypothetical protein